MTTTVRPFSNGGQYSDWSDCNCARCTKGAHRLNDDAAFPDCELEAALLVACFDSGEIPLTIAQRIGMKEDEGRYVWPCAEVQWTEEWKAEYYRLHPELKPVEQHTEYIHCPNCEDIQEATVEHTAPWNIYVHFCTSCGYAILESEWEKATPQEVESYRVISNQVLMTTTKS